MSTRGSTLTSHPIHLSLIPGLNELARSVSGKDSLGNFLFLPFPNIAQILGGKICCVLGLSRWKKTGLSLRHSPREADDWTILNYPRPSPFLLFICLPLLNNYVYIDKANTPAPCPKSSRFPFAIFRVIARCRGLLLGPPRVVRRRRSFLTCIQPGRRRLLRIEFNEIPIYLSQ